MKIHSIAAVLVLPFLSLSNAFGAQIHPSSIDGESVEVLSIEEQNESFTLTITASIWSGVNSCYAEGTVTGFEKQLENGVLNLIPTLQSSDEASMCIEIYSPVYVPTTITIHALKSEVNEIYIHNIGDSLEKKSAFALLLEPKSFETAIEQVSVKSANEPTGDSFSYNITGKILLGTNPCLAQGYQAEFRQHTKGNTIFLKPVITGQLENQICSFEYNPVFVQVNKVIEGVAPSTDIVIQNVDTLGQDVSVFELLD